MKLTFHGAAGEVTGSAYHLQTRQASLLVDFGLFQGVADKDTLNRVPAALDARRLDAVLLTHAHLDHVGRVPLLVPQGFDGPIWCTLATRELTGLILRDSAKVQALDLVRMNRKRERAGQPPLPPLYTADQVEQALARLQAVPYDEPVAVAPGVQARFVEAGHLLGSSSIQLRVEDGPETRCLVFSGDLGPKGAPILKDAEGFQRADLVVLESTYGDRDHKPLAATVAEFEEIVRATVKRGGKILVPTFAVGRAQLLLYLLAQMFRQKTIPPFPIYLDSPMAIEATAIYLRHLELFDAEFQALQRERPLVEDLQTLHPTPTADDSRALNDAPGPCLILAGAGMCNAGRILHHLKQNLWRKETAVIIVGYQAAGSLGRTLLDGAKQVSIFGETIAVRASVRALGGFSAHAGQSDLLGWFDRLAPQHPRVVLTHGEAKGREPLARLLAERYQVTPWLPVLGESLEV